LNRAVKEIQDNPVFIKDNTDMLQGAAKDTVEKLAASVKDIYGSKK
jgi:NAD/NADP transhydrogenase beta subunit